ncbi:protein TPR2 [Artemisia annua]|uniref:Protein TPR2 n=1 Tax=Artemisia annua TaxID=35608 RepID=A0A2U1LBM0_ARTAN|nr:protein TPR2 [Artemisia annua]
MCHFGRDKLTYPSFKSQRLRTFINQSLNWQHQLCKNQKPNPDIRTRIAAQAPLPPNLSGWMPNPPVQITRRPLLDLLLVLVLPMMLLC